MTGTLPATALALAYLAVLAVQTRAALAAARRAPAAAVPDAVGRESVVIAQAILSGDPDLAASLAANPAVLSGVRFLWLVDEDDPRGRETAAAVRAAAPQPQLISLLTCPPPPPGANPKVWKLERAEQRLAPGDILVVLDDDPGCRRRASGRCSRGWSAAAPRRDR